MAGVAEMKILGRFPLEFRTGIKSLDNPGFLYYL